MPEIIISGVDESPQRIQLLEEKGEVRCVFLNVYTDEVNLTPEEWVWKMRYRLIERLIPEAVLSHKTAFHPHSSERLIYLTWPKATRVIQWPGLSLSCLKGPGPHEKDIKIMGIYMSGASRRLLENLQPARRSKHSSSSRKTVDIEELESELQSMLLREGELGLNRLRDEAKCVADELGMKQEYVKLNDMISSFLNTGTFQLKSSSAIAHREGVPYDEDRLLIFMELSLYLQSHRQLFSPITPDHLGDPGSIFAFFEAYFSNYIEGTEFEIQEAHDMIFSGKMIPLRNDDSHDVLGTYGLVNHEYEKSHVPKSADELIDLLKKRHQKILSTRPHKRPGQFKSINNRAGNSHFADHRLVEGTLIKGYEIYETMPIGFLRAAFLMFMISEVHPFEDGNGRISRVMMNAELENANESRIIITTSMRGDYMRNLKALTQSGRIEGYPKMLRSAQVFSSRLPRHDLKSAMAFLNDVKAFEEES